MALPPSARKAFRWSKPLLPLPLKIEDLSSLPGVLSVVEAIADRLPKPAPPEQGFYGCSYGQRGIPTERVRLFHPEGGSSAAPPHPRPRV